LGKVDVLKAFSRLLHPRPVALITCVDKEGKPNALAVSWLTPVAKSPPTIAICVAKSRYSYGLIKETGEFVVNIPAAGLLEAVHYCGTVSGRDVPDKISKAGLSLRQAEAVRAPLIEECVAHLECKVKEVIDCGSHDIFVAEVVAAHADPRFFKEDKWDLEAVELLLHLGGPFYSKPKGTIKAS